MHINDARKDVWSLLENAAIAENNNDIVRAIAFSCKAARCLDTIIERTKQGNEVTVAMRVLKILEDGYPVAAFNYVSDKDVHYHTGSPTRKGWRDL